MLRFVPALLLLRFDDSYLHRTTDIPDLVALSPLTNSPPVFRDRLLIGRPISAEYLANKGACPGPWCRPEIHKSCRLPVFKYDVALNNFALTKHNKLSTIEPIFIICKNVYAM